MAITLDIEKGDILLGGRFKNHKTIVDTLGTDSLGQPTVNGMKLLSFRIAKKMPKEANVNDAYARGFIDKCAEHGVDPVHLLQSLFGKMGEDAPIAKTTSAQPVGTGQQQPLTQSTTATPIPPSLASSTTVKNSKI